MPRSPKLPLTLPEYERIFRIIHGLLLNEDCDPSKACTYFAIIGAALVGKHCRLTAIPQAGAAAYNLGLPENKVIAYGRVDEGRLISDDQAFHAWTLIDDWIVDFAAPLFQGPNVRPKMFQKIKSGVSPDPSQLDSPGSFGHTTNLKLTNSLLEDFKSYQVNLDLVSIATDWYRSPPKKVFTSIPIANAFGKTVEAKLSPVLLVGAW
jgi:hypothetical protein